MKKSNDGGVTEIVPNKKKMSSVSYMGSNGQVSPKGKEDTALGIIIDLGKSKVHRVRAYRNKLFNPLRMKTEPMYKLDNKFRYVNVSYRCFENYQKFLQTHQDSFLNIAERNLL